MARRNHTKEFKVQLLTEIEAGTISTAQASRKHNIAASLISKWRGQYGKYGEEAFQGNGNSYTEEAKIAELERKIGQLTMENDLLKKARSVLQTSFASRKRSVNKS